MRSAVLLSALLVGCGGDQSDLEDYVRKVKARDPGAIEPLPEIKQINTYVYEPAERRDPFVVDARGVDQPVGAPGSSLAPDPLRRKEELEGFALDALRMVGTLEQNQTKWALIRSPNGILHRVRVGNYLGMNNGQIVNISDEAIQLTEIVSEGPGEWRERQATVALTQ
ncbi:pilus assembly protein PilP [uncultured Thiodictyon sp.]|jgi:type IV pilus assembly protein PilP|uniref:pilus assembly protein PilP n=1 Tax=uncultured Thiodictyon sp. TaxID=1846217 RepID=UPI0025E252FB|nr:pilus assembly protein PilP [uncultured Thiodictyon sp.]